MHHEETRYEENDHNQDQIDKLKLDINELYGKVNEIIKAIDSQYMDIKILCNSLSKLNEKFTTHETNKRTNIYSTFI